MSDIAAGSGPEDLLRTALHGANVAEAQAACRALFGLGPPPAALVDLAAAALRDPGTTARRRAANLLGQCGASALPAVPALVEALRDPGWTVREAAARALGPLAAGAPGAEARRALVRLALRDRNRLVRDASARALARLADGSDDALDGLRAGFSQAPAPVRCRALRALAPFAGRADALAADVARLLRDSHRKVRRSAATALGRLGPAAEPALPELIRRLHDGEPIVRRAAAEALARLAPVVGERWRPWLAVLTDPLRGPAESLRIALDHPELPDATRSAFLALCRRRALWHSRRSGLDPSPAPASPHPAGEAVQATLTAAGAARPEEAAWLLARLAELLPPGWSLPPGRIAGEARAGPDGVATHEEAGRSPEAPRPTPSDERGDPAPTPVDRRPPFG